MVKTFHKDKPLNVDISLFICGYFSIYMTNISLQQHVDIICELKPYTPSPRNVLLMYLNGE